MFIWGALLLLSFTSVLLFAERHLDGGVTAFAGQAAALPGTEAERQASTKGLEHTEVYPLMMFAVGGMMLFPASNDLLTMFVALEVLSLPLYLLCGLARRRRLLSQEAALKYFLLGAFSSGFFLYGIALVYGYAGTTELRRHLRGGLRPHRRRRAAARRHRADGGRACCSRSAPRRSTPGRRTSTRAPRPRSPRSWRPAPRSPPSARCCGCSTSPSAPPQRDWTPMIWIIAILTMAVGSVFALTQTDIKRMLAYSSIAHAGFLLVGFVGLQQAGDGDGISSLQSVLFYLVTYGFMTLGAFGVVTLVRDAGGEANHLSRWAGLGKESPLVAGVFAFFLLAMAGIPLTSGFTGKWAVFTAAAQGGAWPLVVVAVLLSVVAAFFYLRVIVLMYFSDPVGDGPTVAVPSILTTVAIAVGLAVTVALGIVPGPVLDLAANAGAFIR